MSLRMDAEDVLERLQISAFPHMETDDRQAIIDNYSHASQDILARQEELDDYSGLEKLKGNL